MKKAVRIRFSNGDTATGLSEPMGFWRFMLESIRFWFRRGTCLNDFDTMMVHFTKGGEIP